MGISETMWNLSGRRCLNIMHAMFIKNMNEKERDKFEDEVWRTAEEWAVIRRKERARGLAAVRDVGEVG